MLPRDLTKQQITLLKLLKQHDGLCSCDEELNPFWDYDGFHGTRHDVVVECMEMGLVTSEVFNHTDLIILTLHGKKLLEKIENGET